VEVFLDFEPNLRIAEAQTRIDRLRHAIAETVPGSEVSILPHPPS
jgi:divalent metal cation (Fe/Co/Zn/Cd) transporter